VKAQPAQPAKTSADRKLISLDHRREVDHWCEALPCTETELRMAVQMVGTSTEEVRARGAGHLGAATALGGSHRPISNRGT